MPQVSRLLALVALACAGCGPGNTLEGSLGEALDLRFDGVEVQADKATLTVLYQRGTVAPKDVVFKLVVRTAGLKIDPRVTIDLAPPDAAPLAVATRVVPNDPVHDLPLVKRGQLSLDAAPEAGKPLTGSFRLTFGEGGDAGKGRQALGTFTVTSVVAGVGS